MNDTNRILLVDDEEANRDMLSRRLQRSGFAVDVAADGESALARVRDGGIDLVLLDSMMPGLTGVDVLKLLRAVHTADQLPVIMVTALSESSKVVEALNLGANDYVTKPVDFPIALARIHSQLARKAAEKALRNSEERYALAARGSNDGLWDWDLVTHRVFYSDRWKAILGYGPDEISCTEEDWFSRVHPDELPLWRRDLESHWAAASPETLESEFRMLHRLGSYRWVRCRGAVVRDPEGKPVRMAGSLADITEAKVFDGLTGLANRLLFQEHLEQALCDYRRDPNAWFAVLFLDLDHFKLINDSLGHAAGDQLLIAAAERLNGCTRIGTSPSRSNPRDLVARFGGDEFTMLLTGLTDIKHVQGIAARIGDQFRQPFEVSGRPVSCTVSVGIALSSPAYQTVSEIIRDADTAMYSAKTAGRSRCALFNEDMRAHLLKRIEMENDLRQAIQRNEIAVYYQTKVRLSDERICGFEALARWKHDKHGSIPPSEFIPIAEDMGVIHELGMSVLRQACAQMRRWQIEYPFIPPLEVSVNLSPLQFRQPDLVEQIIQVVKESGISESTLQLEITESVLLDDRLGAVDMLVRLKQAGIGLKIDDFGTGYSSLSRLTGLPFDSLKIDRSFVAQLSGRDSNLEFIDSIVGMARALGMEVVAEGVEEGGQVSALKTLGCRFAQGFYFSKPVSSEEADKLIARQADSDRLEGEPVAQLDQPYR
ncbi:MAG TPA: EAL domain-containing protein [Bryobacteraceae bacterium]|nr:EAL domain-containing protein [Bryobacteraceae bacterium]